MPHERREICTELLRREELSAAAIECAVCVEICVPGSNGLLPRRSSRRLRCFEESTGVCSFSSPPFVLSVPMLTYQLLPSSCPPSTVLAHTVCLSSCPVLRLLTTSSTWLSHLPCRLSLPRLRHAFSSAHSCLTVLQVCADAVCLLRCMLLLTQPSVFEKERERGESSVKKMLLSSTDCTPRADAAARLPR